MRPSGAIMRAVTLAAVAIAIAARFSAAGADELNDLRVNQAQINSRIDQLAQPTAAPSPLGSPAPNNEPAAGSFPRSFLIPGTNTSIRVGGAIDETLRYR
jgi:hypothetical protein